MTNSQSSTRVCEGLLVASAVVGHHALVAHAQAGDGDKTIVPQLVMSPQSAIDRARSRGVPDSLLAGAETLSICVHIETLPLLCQHCCAELTADKLDKYHGAVDSLNRFFSRMPQDKMRIRCRGLGCAKCNGLGTVGNKFLVEAHGITKQTVDAARTGEWSVPGWTEDLNGLVTRGAAETITALATDAAAAGEVDALDAFDLLGA